MPLLTKSGLEKLASLKKEVESISEKKDEDLLDSSIYSEKMAANALFVLNYIEKNNDKSLGKDEIKKIVSDLKESISIIDNGKMTGVPVIFNKQSYLLTKAFRHALNSLDSKTDINSMLHLALKMKFSKSSESDIFKQNLCEIDMNIQFYDLLINSRSTHKTVTQMRGKISRCNNHYKIMKSPDDVDTFKEKYKEFIDSTLLEIRSLPANILDKESLDQYYNQTVPYNINTNLLKITGITSLLYEQLISLENLFNKLLPPEKAVSFVVDVISEVFKKEEVENYKANVSKQRQALEEDITIYLTGKHLNFFQKIHPEKIKLITSVQAKIKIMQEQKNGDSSLCCPFELYKILTIASIENLKFSKRNKISPGKSGNILAKYQSILLDLTTDRPAGSDEVMLLSLNKHNEEKSLIKKTF